MIIFIHAGVSGISIFFMAVKTPLERGFMMDLLLVSFLGVKATLEQEFMAASSPRSFCFLVR